MVASSLCRCLLSPLFSSRPPELAASYQLRLTNERIRAPEVLFQPSLIGQDCMGLSETLAQVYKTCPKAAYAALTEVSLPPSFLPSGHLFP